MLQVQRSCRYIDHSSPDPIFTTLPSASEEGSSTLIPATKSAATAKYLLSVNAPRGKPFLAGDQWARNRGNSGSSRSAWSKGVEGPCNHNGKFEREIVAFRHFVRANLAGRIRWLANERMLFRYWHDVLQ